MSALNQVLHSPKYKQILEKIKADILTGRYKAGEKLPSEAALVKKFATSRITVGRALHELRQLGLIERRAGSGSYVGTLSQDSGLLFGLLIPNLADTEIFGPIC
jgi:GntR family transcriptional regulator of arabinose operon